jgi:hypothetical protein
VDVAEKMHPTDFGRLQMHLLYLMWDMASMREEACSEILQAWDGRQGWNLKMNYHRQTSRGYSWWIAMDLQLTEERAIILSCGSAAKGS